MATILARLRALTPHQLRWLAVTLVVGFGCALAASDFFSWLNVSFADALERSRITAFSTPVECPPHQPGQGYNFGGCVHHAINIPMRPLAIGTGLAVTALLFVASARQRRERGG